MHFLENVSIKNPPHPPHIIIAGVYIFISLYYIIPVPRTVATALNI